jgi:hypothetical protein
VEQADQVFNETMVATWKQEFEDKLKPQNKTSITLAKDEILEMISTTKGELLIHLNTLQADMMEHKIKLEHCMKIAEKVFPKLQKQQGEMERLSQDIQMQQTTLQEFLKTNSITERQEIQTTCEGARKGFKWDIEQAS